MYCNCWPILKQVLLPISSHRLHHIHIFNRSIINGNISKFRERRNIYIHKLNKLYVNLYKIQLQNIQFTTILLKSNKNHEEAL